MKQKPAGGLNAFFESLMGYDVLTHISREHAVHGVGDTEYCDFAVQIGEDESSAPNMLVEIKRVNIDLSSKHIKQASSYAINCGCEWVLLTNGKEWRLYHIAFGKPPQIQLINSWNLMTGEPASLAEYFELVGYRNLKKSGLSKLWVKSNVLTTQNILKTILSEDSINLLRRKLKRSTDVTVTPEEIIGSVRRLLNEASLAEMEKLKISVTDNKKKRAVSTRKNQPQETKQEADIDTIIQEVFNGQQR